MSRFTQGTERRSECLCDRGRGIQREEDKLLGKGQIMERLKRVLKMSVTFNV